MSDFWKLSTGESVATTETTYEAPSGGGDYVFAEGTKVKVIMEEVKYDSFNGGEECIKTRLSVVAPETDLHGVKISNRKIFWSMWPEGNARQNTNEEKRIRKSNKDKTMFGVLNSITGNKLDTSVKPTNEQMASAFCMKPFVVRLGAMETDKGKGINFIQALAPANAATEVSGQHVPKAGAVGKVQATPTASKNYTSDSDDIPF